MRLAPGFSILFLVAIGVLPAGPASGVASGAAAGASETVVLLPTGPDPAAAAAVRLISSSDEDLLLEFRLPAISVQPLEIDGVTYHALEIPGGGVTGALGAPMLPTFSRLIRIPDRAGVSIEVTAVETTELTGYRPMPMQSEDGADFADFVIDPQAYARSGYAECEPVRLGRPAIARDLRVVPITFQPVRCDPAGECLEVATRIEVRVTFAGVDLRNARERHTRVIPSSFEQLYRGLVVNCGNAAVGDGDLGTGCEGLSVGAEDPRDTQIALLGAYVVICPDDDDVLAALAPLIEWRTRQGFAVTVATTAETGSTPEAIKSWLQNAYDTWDNPPEYITLIGDANGSLAIPCWYETWSGHHGEGDHPYVQLEGDDVLADAHIGRISVDTLERLQLYVTKIVGYESTPYMADTDWYTRACLVGDPSISGYTCIQVMQWHKARLLEWGYTEIDTVFSEPWVMQMLAAANRGDTVFSYRGFYGMSGFDTGEIMALQNGWKMPFAVNLTCLTGSFASGTSRSEAWIRAGLPPNIPTGGIASIGTATGGTHTRYNNCITYGIWRAAFWDGMYRFGAGLTRGKYELYINYGVQDPGNVRSFSHWNNLMGDPAGELWTAVPQAMSVEHPIEVALGTNAVSVAVTADGAPCAGAYVCLWKEGETHVGGYTDAGGAVELPVTVSTEGGVKVTVTKHDHHPYLATIAAGQAERFVAYRSHTVDDDADGSSNGNGDGQPNPTETLEIPVQVENFGTQSAPDVTGILSVDDSYVTILDGVEEFGTISGGESAWSVDDFDIAIAGGAPDGHVIRLGLDLETAGDAWHSLIEIPVVAAAFAYDDVTLYDFGSRIDPGETGEISLRIENVGGAAGADVSGRLVSQSAWVVVSDDQGSFGTIGVGSSGENSGDRFGLEVAADCFQGHIVPMVLLLEFSGGVLDTVVFALEIGQVDGDDPTGPDAYGYYAFDNTDTAYEQAPTYDWVEIDPNHGGAGISVGLGDFGQGQEDSKTVALPFPFTYYGVTFADVTICSNGWIAMGSTTLTNYRNWNIPGAGAPENMIAVMWDNLYQAGNNQVYHWYDAANHRYIVQWSRLRNMAGGHTENFQVILYDETEYPTTTGDGIIVFQYDIFNNSDHVQNYSTSGIQNRDRDDGVMYGYFNYYNSGAAAIGSGRAIKFVAFSDSTWGLLSGTVANATNGGTPLAGAVVLLVEADLTLVSGADGVYGGSVPAGTFTLIAAHGSFAPDTLWGVTIIEGGSTEQDFALVDIAGPAFFGTTDLPSTSDTQGPYEVQTTVSDHSELAELSLRYRIIGGDWNEVPLEEQGDEIHAALIPGQPRGSLVLYYLYGRDIGENAGTDPPDAPSETYWFWVLEPQFDDDMEDGSGSWTHYVVTDGYVDQWHRSSDRNHTDGGAWSWKFGSTSGGDYARLGDGALVSEPFELEGVATMRFWHWIDAEIFWYGNEFAFDGGLVEISIDGGPWGPIIPEGGYPYRVMDWQGGSPFAAGTWVYAGEQGWTQAEFVLEEMNGTAQVRFRFGSDNLEVGSHEGWYIDDVEIVLPGADPSAAREIELQPTRVALHQNSPNPFGAGSAGTRICFDLPRSCAVSLRVHDVAGRLVRTLLDERLAVGAHRVDWSGHGTAGERVDSGVYFYVLEINGQRRARRMLILK